MWNVQPKRSHGLDVYEIQHTDWNWSLYMRQHTHTHKHTQTHTHKHTNTHTHTHERTHARTHARTHTHSFTIFPIPVNERWRLRNLICKHWFLTGCNVVVVKLICLQDRSVQWPVLKGTNLHIGTRVGLAVLNTDRSLHLYVDGTERGVVAPHVPDPCYFMFDLYSHCTQVLYWFCQFLSWFVLLFLYFLSRERRIRIGF